jgi:hypothetical protein
LSSCQPEAINGAQRPRGGIEHVAAGDVLDEKTVGVRHYSNSWLSECGGPMVVLKISGNSALVRNPLL